MLNWSPRGPIRPCPRPTSGALLSSVDSLYTLLSNWIQTNRTPRAFSLSIRLHRHRRNEKRDTRYLSYDFLVDGGRRDGQFKHERKNQASANMTQSAIYCTPIQKYVGVFSLFVCLNVSSEPAGANQGPSFGMSDKALSTSHFPPADWH